MPSFTTTQSGKFDAPVEIPYAEEQDVLAFANRIRQAGGAELLPALLPSIPQDTNSCLIANALNFNASVKVFHGPAVAAQEGEMVWYMDLRGQKTEQEIVKLAYSAGVEVACYTTGGWSNNPSLEPVGIRLPRLIGNAAQAFDALEDCKDGWVIKYRPGYVEPRPTVTVSRYDATTGFDVNPTLEYAREDEVLDFANLLREQGGADTLEALMPSTPSNSQRCLIANALNFSSDVDGMGRENWLSDEQRDRLTAGLQKGESLWKMTFPENMPATKINQIVAATGCELAQVDTYEPTTGTFGPKRRAIILPRHIGNAAAAFDTLNHHGWVAKYRK